MEQSGLAYDAVPKEDVQRLKAQLQVRYRVQSKHAGAAPSVPFHDGLTDLPITSPTPIYIPHTHTHTYAYRPSPSSPSSPATGRAPARWWT